MPHEAAAPRHSALYCGTVYHRRTQPRAHSLSYRVFYLLLDLDERDALDHTSAVFGWNRPAWLAFHERDHGDGVQPLRDWLTQSLVTAGLAAGPWRFRLLCMPRMAGYVFNPITVIYCFDEAEQLGAIIYEVNNTFGERIAYVAPVARREPLIRQRCDKAMFVSPFFDMDGHYDFTLSPPGETLSLHIDYRLGDEQRLLAVFSGERLAWSAAALRQVALAYPLATFKVFAGIHFEALRLWLKGVPVIGHIARTRPPIIVGTEE